MEYASIETSLDRLVKGIVRLANPERIILFGSAARGQVGPESDLDVLVVVPEGTAEREMSRRRHEPEGRLTKVISSAAARLHQSRARARSCHASNRR